MIMHFAYIGASLIGLALIAAWMFVVSRRPVLYRVAGATLALWLAFTAWSNVNAMMGYAISGEPSIEVELVGMVDDRQHGFIYLWVKEPEGLRAYKIVYSEQLAKSLMKAASDAEGQHGGAKIRIKFNSNGKSSGQGGFGQQSGLGHDDSQPVTITVVPLLPPKD